MEWLWRWMVVVVVHCLVLVVILKENCVIAAGDVTYDGRSLIINGQRRILFSGSIHYPRSTPQMWSSLIAKAKEGGVDVIQTYVFWNLHQPKPGQYDFSGRNDLVKFIKEIQAQGLYACLRIGPFIESEWNYGGFPFWLHDVPGIIYRSDNEPFKIQQSNWGRVYFSLIADHQWMMVEHEATRLERSYALDIQSKLCKDFASAMFYMQNFTTKIVNLMKSESLYASQGGPIILSQIENEYQNVEAAFGEKGHSYVRWAAKMAVELQTGVPWVMCKQTDAPDPVINTCNGMRCGETFGGPNSPNKPSLWTEDWTSFYQVYGGEPYIRSAEDIAFHAALFIARNGSYINYYMYHGGTNFGRTSSAYVITGYYDQSPLDEYGLLRQPKWGHLKELHAAIKNCSKTLLEGVPSNSSLGQLQEAYTFTEEAGGGCVAFLINNDQRNNATVQFQNQSFVLLPKSISILPDCQNVIFNTAKVKTKPNKRFIKAKVKFDSEDIWEEFKDATPTFDDTSLKSDRLLEQMNTTKDESDYLWYTLRFQHNISCTEPVLAVKSLGHVAHAFINSIYVGNAHGNHSVKGFSMENPITLDEGTMNNISLLSVMVGLPDSGAFLESRYAGFNSVEIQCTEKENLYNFTKYAWGYQVGLLGEKLQIYKEENLEKVEWSKLGDSSNQTLTWYKTVFDEPGGDDPVALDLSSMGKGETWVNGQSIGRYWVSFYTPKGTPSQTLYHVPRSFLKKSENLLVLVEEIGGNPLQITLDTIRVTSLRHENDTSFHHHLPLSQQPS